LLNERKLNEVSVPEVRINPEAKAEVAAGQNEENVTLIEARRFTVDKKKRIMRNTELHNCEMLFSLGLAILKRDIFTVYKFYTSERSFKNLAIKLVRCKIFLFLSMF
jgi:hypothetical protein